MKILEENKFEQFKALIRSNRPLAIQALKVGAIHPHRRIQCETPKWKCIINEVICLSKNNKFYVKRNKVEEIIISPTTIYTKHNGALKMVSPFRTYLSLMSKEEVFNHYKIDFLLPYDKYMEGESLTFIRKHGITNFEQYFKLKFPSIPYRFFKQNLQSYGYHSLLQLNDKLSHSKNPNTLNKDLSHNLLGEYILSDTVNMAAKLGEKVDLRWSKSRWKLQHDLYNRRIMEIKERFIDVAPLGTDEKFKNILPKEWELIDDTKRLFREGQYMQHCVASSSYYQDRIKAGVGAIYSYKTPEGIPYTLELSLVRNQYHN